MKIIAGADEAGRGPLAGPVVGAVVVLPNGFRDQRIRDSKQLSAENREYLSDYIKEVAVAYAIIAVGHVRIESINIREASRLAMGLALERVRKKIEPTLLLVDGNMELFTNLPQRAVVKGDTLHVQISAASIIAKVWRDSLMKKLDGRYPGYGLGKHAGYATAQHRSSIADLGPSRIHRKTFRGVFEYLPSQF